MKPTNAAVEALISRLKRTTEQIYSEEELRSRLASGRQLRLKFGVDLTAPFLHLGHAVNLWMYRALQEAGHKLVFLLGDFTTLIGDPTGRSNLRPVLTDDERDQNGLEFLRQVTMVVHDDPSVFEIRRNSEWFGPMRTAEFLSIVSAVTHQRLISRDMFQERIKQSKEIYAHELLYPVLQGYDSAMLKSDITVVGSDQLFNETLGRFYQERTGQPPQVIITSKVTPGLDGGPKQSKSLGNYVALVHSPREKYGKLMSISDDLVRQYFEVYTEVPMDEIARFQTSLGPMELKKELAKSVVARYHGANAADAEAQWFTSTFSNREMPADAPEVKVGRDRIAVLDLLKLCKPDETNSQLKRLLEQGAVEIGGERKTAPTDEITLPPEGLPVKIGKRAWFIARP